MQSNVYWSGTEYARYTRLAWGFLADTGGQNDDKDSQMYAWAVRSGQVDAAVPLPATAGLVALGLMLLGPVGVGRRRLW